MDLTQTANINLLMKARFVDPSQALNSFSVNGPTVSTPHPNLHMSHQVRSATTILPPPPFFFSNGFDVHRFTYSEFIDRGQTVKSEFHCKSWDSKEKICWTSWTVVKRAYGCCPAKSSQLRADQTAWLSTLKISCRNSLLFFMSNKNRLVSADSQRIQ